MHDRRWSLLRSAVVSAVVAVILVGVAAGLLISTVLALGSAQRYQNDQLDPAETGTTTLLSDYLDQETAIRGYVLDGQAFFLQPYEQASAQIPRLQPRIAALVAHDRRAAAPAAATLAAYQRWSTTFALPQLQRVGTGHLAAAQQAEASGQGKALFDTIRIPVGQLQSVLRDERRSSEHRVTDLQDRIEGLLITLLVLGSVAIALALWVAVRRVVRPLEALAAAARIIAGGRLHAQVPVGGPKEVRDLSADFTAMRYRLLEEITRARLAGEALQLDSPTVSALQEALTPRRDEHPDLEVVGRLDPAEGVLAGDWYDLLRIGDGLAVVVGDVSGHGPRSAVLALGLRSVITTRLSAGGDPGAALAVATASIAEGSPERFATVFVARVDPVAGTLRYASAGHPAALLARERGGSEELEPTGPFVSPVVAGGRWTWETVTLPFEPGDRLLVYTDGVTEGRNATREQYGLDRLKQDLVGTGSETPGGAVQAIADHVDRFVGGAQSDDRTIVYVVNAVRRAALT